MTERQAASGLGTRGGDPAGMRRLLVPLDGSALAEQALPYAARLAAPGAEIVLLQVVPNPQLLRDAIGGTGVAADQLARGYEVAAREDLDAAAGRLRGLAEGVRVEVAAAVGDPAEQILRAARERGADLVALASHGRGAAGRLFFGSVADRVARSAPVPVLIVRADPAAPDPARAEVRRLVVPLDGSDLARHALPVAASLAAPLRVPIHLLTVVDILRLVPPSLMAVPAFNPGVYDDAIARLRRDAEAALPWAAAELEPAGVPVSWEVVDGAPGAAIVDAARPGDLIVLTSHGRGGLARWLLGSVAEKLVRHAPVPVVVVPSAADGPPTAGTGA